MDISKLSFHTQKAKKFIARALRQNDNALARFGPKSKKITIDISSPKKIISTINKILGENVQEVKKIESYLVADHICGKDGAAAILANSMLTKNKKDESSFKNLAEKLKGITEENNLSQENSTEIETSLKKYIASKRRGVSSFKDESESNGSEGEEKGENPSDVEDAREIDWLKLLCALLVLYVAETTETNERIDGANEFIKKEVTEITKESTTFYELKSEFERILKIQAILRRDAVLQSLLEYIGECLNKTNFVSIPIELFLKANESLFSSIDKSTSDVLIGFLKKAKELASNRSGDPSEEMSQLISDIDKGREEQLIRYLKDKIEIEKIRTVGNVNDTVTQKYVISQDGTELIIYPFLENKGFLYVFNHLCKIGNDSIEKSDYTNKIDDFPESKLYTDIDKCPVDLFKPALLNAQARVRLLSKWEDFLNEKVTYVNSKDESKEYTYKQIIEMSKDDRDKLFGELYEEITQCVQQLKSIGIQKIRTVGNVNDTVTQKYVISQDGTELIIYPSFEYKDSLDVFNHVCKIGNDSIERSDYTNKKDDFPESKLYDIDKCPVDLFKPALLNAQARVRLLSKWKDFLKETVSYVNSQDESKEYTYKQIIEMKEDDRNKLFGELYEIEKLRQEVKKK